MDEMVDISNSRNINSPFSLVLNSYSLTIPNFFSWELNFPKFLVVEKVGGTNFHGFIFLWVRKDNIFVNFKLQGIS